MSALIDTLRAIVRDEMSRLRPPELGIVLDVYANDADGNNHQVDVRLQASGVNLQRVPVTVPRYGMSMLPRADDLVLVNFIGGDLNSAIVVGCVYDDRTQPPEGAPGELVYKIPDDGGERHLHMELPSGVSYTVDDEALKIVAGGTEIYLEQDGDVRIVAGGNIEIESGGDISMTAGGNMKLEAGIELALSAPNVKSEGQASNEVKGAMIKVAGMTQFSAS